MSYNRTEYLTNRERALTYLGGKCVRCGATERLEFDHVDSKTKSFSIGKNLNRKWLSLKDELDKCQLLCKPCHQAKTRESSDHVGGHNKWKEVKHGTLHAYNHYKCRCEDCRRAKRDSRPR